MSTNERPSCQTVTNVIATGLKTFREPVEVLGYLAQEVQDPHWHRVICCTADAVVRLLADEDPEEVFAETFVGTEHLGFLRQFALALTCVAVAIEEGASPLRAIKLASHTCQPVEIPIMAAVFGAYHWGLGAYSPEWRNLIEQQMRPAAA